MAQDNATARDKAVAPPDATPAAPLAGGAPRQSLSSALEAAAIPPALQAARPNSNTALGAPPPLPAARSAAPSSGATAGPAGAEYVTSDAPNTTDAAAPKRRQAKRKPAGAAPSRVAANDDVPSIGGLIYALERKPSKQPYIVASWASGVWFAVGLLFAYGMLAPEFAKLTSAAEFFARPTLLIVIATIGLPILLFWFLAMLVWRAQELRLMSSAMTEVAVRLAEPDRHAEQSAASLGQAVRQQVVFMNEAVSRALGRAGELEAMVHNEVSNLERSYTDNEHRIRGLIHELAGERQALTATTDTMHGTLKSVGAEVPALIEKLSGQQIKLAKIIEGAGQNLLALETSLNKASNSLETNLGEKTTHLQAVLDDYSTTLHEALADRTGHLQNVLDGYTEAINGALGNRTNEIQGVFETYTQALDSTLIERTRALDNAFSERLQLFDESINRSTLAIDGAVGEKARALTIAMESHAQQLAETLGKQASGLDETLMHGINAVRRTSETITRQSVKAIEGLSGHTDLLKNVSDNLLTQINSVTNRFETQGQTIMRAAGALETANYKIDSTLQNRHRELTETLGKMSHKADELDGVMRNYSTSIEGSMTEAEARARQLTQQLTRGAETHSQTTLAELERLKRESEAQTNRALEDLRSRFSNVTSEVNSQVGTLTARLNETTEDIRAKTERATAEFSADHARLRGEAERLPEAARASADVMRNVVQEQLRALQQLSTFTDREMARRQVSPPVPLVEAPYHTEPPRQFLQQQPVYSQPQQYAQSQPVYAQPQQPVPQPQPVGQPQQQPRWSLGDLLARASQGEGQPHAAADGHNNSINIDGISRALDPATASAIWSRLRSGQRGIMVRSIYSAEGRVLFDEVSRRYTSEGEFRGTVDRFLGEFEMMLRDTEQKDPSGRVLQGHLVSGSGRVYLFLAHASGRLT
jgi:hypothetical protein